MHNFRVKRGYTVHMRAGVHVEGSVLENVTPRELAEHGIRLEPAEHQAFRDAITPEQKNAEDLKQRMSADGKYTEMYERTLRQVAQDLIDKNPMLAAMIVELQGKQDEHSIQAIQDELDLLEKKEAEEKAKAGATQVDGMAALPSGKKDEKKDEKLKK